MFSGKKSSLKPIFDRLVELAARLGEDVKICPCKTIVPFYRNYVFAEIKPTTQTRVDLGLSLRNCEEQFPDTLIETRGAQTGDRITHRFALTSVDHIDATVEKWLRIAYTLDQ